MDPLNPFDKAVIPLEKWVEDGLDWLVNEYRDVFQAIRQPIDGVLDSVLWGLNHIPATIFIILAVLAVWQVAGGRNGILTLVSLVLIGLLGAWDEAMVTLSLVVTAVFFCVVLGIPTGIMLASSNRMEAIFRPILDAMQTTPAFVYLVPIVMLFGIGNVPGVVVTIIFAVPPIVRLTNLGIRQVPPDVIEASHAFGASRLQLLWKVQLPLAMRTIMAGLNQTLMLALSMVVIASMISVGGLGQMVLRGIGRLDMGLATIGGLGIVLLAIVIDRFTQALGQPASARGKGAWFERGPARFIAPLFRSGT